MFSITKTFKSSILGLAVVSGLGLSANTVIAGGSALTFTEIPFDVPTARTAVVSDNGVVAFAGDNGLYKWTASAGVELLADTSSFSRTVSPQISADGNVITFTGATSISIPGEESGVPVFKNGVLSVIPSADFSPSSSSLVISGLSDDGDTFAGRSSAGPASFYDIETGNIEVVEDPGLDFIRALDVSEDGSTKLISGRNDAPGFGGFFPFSYVQRGDQAPELVEGLTFASALSGNGQSVIGEASLGDACEVPGFLVVGFCAVLYSVDNQTVVNMGRFRPRSASRDASIVTGGAFTDEGGVVVWDSFNGRRFLRDILATNNIDVTGWTFSSLIVSSNGTKMAGFGTNPQGLIRPFVININGQCIPF